MSRGHRASRAAAPDGRALRSERSRAAIVQALLGLVGEGIVEPTAQQVAERAGVGLRTVFRHFDDMEVLFAAVDARVQADALPLLPDEPPQGPLAERVRALVARRSAFFERIAPYKRAGQLRRNRSPFLTGQHEALRRELRRRLLQALPELAQAPADLVDAFEQATSFEAWDRLRSEQRASRARAVAAMLRMAAALAHDLEALEGSPWTSSTRPPSDSKR